jgi:hypothetical protein
MGCWQLVSRFWPAAILGSFLPSRAGDSRPAPRREFRLREGGGRGGRVQQLHSLPQQPGLQIIDGLEGDKPHGRDATPRLQGVGCAYLLFEGSAVPVPSLVAVTAAMAFHQFAQVQAEQCQP